MIVITCKDENVGLSVWMARIFLKETNYRFMGYLSQNVDDADDYIAT